MDALKKRIAELEAQLAATKRAALNLADATSRTSQVELEKAKKIHAMSRVSDRQMQF